MAMVDYGAVVKKNGKLLPRDREEFFYNYSTLNGGVYHEEKGIITFDDGSTCESIIKSEHIGDESERIDFNGEKRSIIHNYMAVVGDEDFLVATYKNGLIVCDKEKYIISYMLGEDDTWWDPNDENSNYYVEHHNVVKYLDTPFGTIKIKRLEYDNFVGIASFRYKGDNYEILFGYGVDDKEFIFSKSAERYFIMKTLRKIRRWFKRGE